jgi:catechol 2,3-dioxygenase-like lactoylglutathione lyase family enzyme
MMLSSGDIIAFVSTTDLDRAQAFYAGVLGLEPTDQSQFAAVFRVGSTMLRVTKVDEVPVAPYTVLGWAVSDIEREVRELGDRGVVFRRYDGMSQDTLGIWTTPSGERVAWFGDPDGNTLSVTQFG